MEQVQSQSGGVQAAASTLLALFIPLRWPSAYKRGLLDKYPESLELTADPLRLHPAEQAASFPFLYLSCINSEKPCLGLTGLYLGPVHPSSSIPLCFPPGCLCNAHSTQRALSGLQSSSRNTSQPNTGAS